MKSPARLSLPGRRQNDTREFDFAGTTFRVCIGYDDHGQPYEVFADGAKTGAAVGALLSDACVIISIALQHGIAAEDLGKSLGREPGFRRGQLTEVAASLIGEIVAALQPRPELKRLMA